MTISNNFDENYINLLLQKGNLPQAEILLRQALNKSPENPVIYYYLGELSSVIGQPEFAMEYFQRSSILRPEWNVPADRFKQLEITFHSNSNSNSNSNSKNNKARKNKINKFILIKAWGYGFWSDVFHVLGMLLLAEVTGRIPIVYWGKNSHFGNPDDTNAFDSFFEPVSFYSINDIRSTKFDYFPPKWDTKNLLEDNINKWSGQGSRLAGLYLLGRNEKVLVSDFYTGVLDLMPWIPIDHPLYGKSIDELYDYLIKKYLKPKREILDQVNKFCQFSLNSVDFISVHMRGSDKVTEVPDLEDLNSECFSEISKHLQKNANSKIFLMTDDEAIKEDFFKRYGDITKVTECQRTSDKIGIHNHENVDKKSLGVEVMIDTYIAARGRVIIGNARSNPSLMLRYLKGWDDPNIKLLGDSMLNQYNMLLHSW